MATSIEKATQDKTENTAPSERRKGYRICFDHGHLDSPYCLHGPTLLFEKIGDIGEVSERFFACSACRDRKECSFYLRADTEVTAEKLTLKKELYCQANKLNDAFQIHSFREKPLKFCQDCGVFVPNALCKDPAHMNGFKLLTESEMLHPTTWLYAKRNNKKNAQFFFSEEVVTFVVDTLTAMNVKNVLCIGTPSVHEHIMSLPESRGLNSFLLDLDVRLRQFFKNFAHYNMFNHHFFNEDELKRLTDFFNNDSKMAAIVDPPYGGLMEALSCSISKFRQQDKIDHILLFFPYYMEHQIVRFFPGLNMSDYKVDYSNHSGYRGGPDGKARGSPARLYTDIPLSQLVLPRRQYRFCKDCRKYVSLSNKHCPACNQCTTKDGPTYIHCKLCNRCVKPSRVHCASCGTCQLNDHDCKSQTNVESQGCYICGNQDHKKKNCPTLKLKHKVKQSVELRPYKRRRP